MNKSIIKNIKIKEITWELRDRVTGNLSDKVNSFHKLVTYISYKYYRWDALKQSILIDGYDVDKYGYIRVEETSGEFNYRVVNGNHRISVLYNMFGENHKIKVKVTNNRTKVKKILLNKCEPGLQTLINKLHEDFSGKNIKQLVEGGYIIYSINEWLCQFINPYTGKFREDNSLEKLIKDKENIILVDVEKEKLVPYRVILSVSMLMIWAYFIPILLLSVVATVVVAISIPNADTKNKKMELKMVEGTYRVLGVKIEDKSKINIFKWVLLNVNMNLQIILLTLSSITLLVGITYTQPWLLLSLLLLLPFDEVKTLLKNND